MLEKAECEKLGMGLYLGVAEASQEPPKFIHLTYTPKGGMGWGMGGLVVPDSDGSMPSAAGACGALCAAKLQESKARCLACSPPPHTLWC